MCGILAWGFPQWDAMFLVGLAACFASATGDTLSSELGNVLGKRYVDVLTFKTGPRGADGIISLEGSLVGVLGSLVIALLFGAGYGWNGGVLVVCVAGIVGNYLDSVYGATIQRRAWVNNDEVNLLSTSSAALIGMVLAGLL